MGEPDQVGRFAVRRAVPVIAHAIKASRSAVYALLAEHPAQGAHA